MLVCVTTRQDKIVRELGQNVKESQEGGATRLRENVSCERSLTGLWIPQVVRIIYSLRTGS